MCAGCGTPPARAALPVADARAVADGMTEPTGGVFSLPAVVCGGAEDAQPTTARTSRAAPAAAEGPPRMAGHKGRESDPAVPSRDSSMR